MGLFEPQLSHQFVQGLLLGFFRGGPQSLCHQMIVCVPFGPDLSQTRSCAGNGNFLPRSEHKKRHNRRSSSDEEDTESRARVHM
jgi:hypothetical protein